MCIRTDRQYKCGCKDRGPAQFCDRKPRCLIVEIAVVQADDICGGCADIPPFVFVDPDGKSSEYMQAKRRKTND